MPESPADGPGARPRPTLARSRVLAARMHCLILAAVLLVTSAMYLLTGSGARNRFDRLKGADFVQLYTYGRLALTQSTEGMYDPATFFRRQVEFVPASERERYLPVYPPHVALIFAPLARLSYERAVLAYAALSMLLYAAVVALAVRPFQRRVDGPLVGLAAAAFPPLSAVVIGGQTSIVPLVAFCLCWMALERGRRFLAGAALGLLLLKPQFAIVTVLVVVTCGEWAMLLGGAVSVGIQALAVAATLGPRLLVDYGRIVPRLAGWRPLLEPKPAEMHSLATLTDLLPDPWSTAGLVLLTVATTAIARTVWVASTSWSLRVGILVLASSLCNPHLMGYDAVVLMLPLIWFAAWIASKEGKDRHLAGSAWVLVYGLYLTLLFPTARLIHLQVSVVLMVAGLLLVARRVRAEQIGAVLHQDQTT